MVVVEGSQGRSDAILRRLAFLYGDEAAPGVHASLVQLLDRFRPRLQETTGGWDVLFDEEDALLITYGDSVLAAGRPPLQALGEFASEYLQDLVSGIHVLPFFPYSSDYGFSVLDYLRVNPALGDWRDIAQLGTRFKLMFDLVLNHVSARGEWFQRFLAAEPPYDDFFIRVDPGTDLSAVTRPRTSPLLTRFQAADGERWVWTTFGPDQVDLNYANPEVLLRMVEVVLTYVERGARLLRMDAIAYLWKQPGTACVHLPQTHQLVKLFRDVLDEVAPQVLIVTETNVPHRENVSYFGDGRDEAQMVYQFPLAPLVLDAFATADGGRLRDWIAGLELPGSRTAFFNFLASHDGIGVVPARGILADDAINDLAVKVRAQGGEVSLKTNPDGSDSPYELNSTFFDALSNPADNEAWEVKRDRFLCSQAIMLALAGVPGVYIHSLFGSHNDHLTYGRTGWKRDLNHERLQLDALAAALADPRSEPGQLFSGYRRLLSVRRAQAAFHPNAPQQVLDTGAAVLGLLRGPRNGQSVLGLHNLSAQGQEVPAASLERLGGDSAARDLLTDRLIAPGQPLALGPYEVLWLMPVDRAPSGRGPASA